MKTDSDLRVEVRTEIARQRGSRADEVDVQVRQGAVTLTGSLPSDIERWSLRDAIGGISRVERIVDETMIVSEPSLRSPDADVARP